MNNTPLGPAAPKANTRQQLFVAPEAQGHLLLRIMVYCMAVSAATALMCCVSLGVVSSRPSTIWLGAPTLTLMLVAPFVLYDAARASNRLVGPLPRLQHTVRQLANGQRPETITIRTQDLYPEEWLSDFNRMVRESELSTPRGQRSGAAE